MNKTSKLIIASILLLIAANVASNYNEEAQEDGNKLPEKVEESNGFQRWITNHKKRMDVAADDFNLKDINEVYNATYLEITRLEGNKAVAEHLEYIQTFEDVDETAISLDGREVLDYRHEKRDGYQPFEVHFYGLREDKLIDTKILSCVPEANCYFDRAYFIDNHAFVISEISRSDIDRKIVEGGDYKACDIEEICPYSFKLHFIDLLKNERAVYETHSFDKILADMIEFF
ncbi:hypothetical protein HN803_00530 [candidate division WWE3 bacterium]|mgnify:FL=1|jgi:hypothetical protein|nr:hypothetical protein [candidate division WWE3 bacterium]MBT7349269.1 hypothetical protein [candidate division WWE3 bacterium]